MRNLFFLPLVVLGFVIPLSLSSCASSDAPLQSRIERKIDTPNNGNVDIGTAHYNRFSQEFDDPWPFGPYSSFLIIRQGEQPWIKELKNSRIQEAQAIRRQTTRCLQRRGEKIISNRTDPGSSTLPEFLSP